MALDFSISIEGEKQISRRLLIVSDGINDFQEPLRTSGNELLKTFQLNFAQEGGLFGGWAPRKRDYPWPILQKTGRMRQGFLSRVSPDELVLYNPTPYFPYHQSNKPRTRLPRRVMMKIDNDRRNFIIKTLQAYIVSLTRR